MLPWVFARNMLGFSRPRRPVLGMELAGVIEAAGADVKQFERGDAVFAFTGFRFGAYSEYVCLPVDGQPSKVGMVAKKPVNMSYVEAAPVAGGAITALLVLRKANIQPGQSVVVYGASVCGEGTQEGERRRRRARPCRVIVSAVQGGLS